MTPDGGSSANGFFQGVITGTTNEIDIATSSTGIVLGISSSYSGGGGGAVDSIANFANNRILTASDADSINGESTFTYDGAGVMKIDYSDRVTVSLDGEKTSDAIFAQVAAANAGDSVAGMYFWRDGANDAGAISWATQPTSTTTLEERMRITSAGKVGIGVTAPTDTLAVRGGIKIGEFNDTDGTGYAGSAAPSASNLGTGSADPQLRVSGRTSDAPGIIQMAFFDANNFFGGTGVFTLGRLQYAMNENSNEVTTVAEIRGITSNPNDPGHFDGALTFWTSQGGTVGANLTEKMILNADGRLGIGTTSPAGLLHVDHTASTGSALRVTRNLTSGDMDSPLAYLHDDSQYSDEITLTVINDGSERVALFAGGGGIQADRLTLNPDEPTREQANSAYSKWWCSVTTSSNVQYAVSEPNTDIYKEVISTGEVTLVKSGIGPEQGELDDVTVDCYYYTNNKPIAFLPADRHFNMVPLTAAGKYFGFASTRYYDTGAKIHVHSPHGYAAVRYYNSSIQAFADTGGNLIATLELNKGQSGSFSPNATGNPHYHFIEVISGADVIVSRQGTSGDHGVLLPMSSSVCVYGSDELYSNIYGTSEQGMVSATGTTTLKLITGQYPIWATDVADGAGSDAEDHIPTTMLADNYIVPGSISGYMLMAGMCGPSSTTATTISANYWNGSAWVKFDVHELIGTYKSPTGHSQGTLSGAGADLGTNAEFWMFTANHPFFLRTNDTSEDEWTVFTGYNTDYHALQVGTSGVAGLPVDTFVITAEESDDYISSSAGAGNANGFWPSYGNGAHNSNKSQTGTDFGIVIPRDCTLTRVDLTFGNIGGETNSSNQTITVYKNSSSTTTAFTYNASASGGGPFNTHHTNLTGTGTTFSAGDTFNIRATGLSGYTNTQVGPARMTAYFTAA